MVYYIYIQKIILIQFDTGVRLSMKADPETGIDLVKEEIGNMKSKPSLLIKLFCHDKELHNNQTLLSCHLVDNDVIFCKIVDTDKEKDINETSAGQITGHPGEGNSGVQTASPEKPRKYKNDPETFFDQLIFIQNMGFPHQMVKCALRSTMYNTSVAIGLLLGKSEDSDEDEIICNSQDTNPKSSRSERISREETSSEEDMIDYDESDEYSCAEEYAEQLITRKKIDGRSKKVKFRSSLRETSHWTPEQDELLFKKWLEYGSDWNRILTYFPDRTKAAVSLHWTAHLRDIMVRENRISNSELLAKGAIRTAGKKGVSGRRRGRIPNALKNAQEKAAPTVNRVSARNRKGLNKSPSYDTTNDESNADNEESENDIDGEEGEEDDEEEE